MKICFFANANSIHTVKWVNTLVKRGHEVYLISLFEPTKDSIEPAVKIFVLKVSNKLGYYLNFFEVKRILKIIKPDIIHAHYASGYGTLSRLINFKPTLLSVWGSDVYIFPQKNKLNKWILQKNLKAATRIGSTSKNMELEIMKYVDSTHNIVVTPFGIDTNKFRSINKKDSDLITIGTVKRLESTYGIDILIHSFNTLIERLIEENQNHLAKRLRLKIVGRGSQEEYLKNLVYSLGISELTEFVGYVKNDLVPHYLNDLDIYCAFSRSESFGVAILEASACEVPVIVSNVGGLPEVVENNITGYVIDIESTDVIVEKLYNLISDYSLRTIMGKNGRDLVLKRYEWNNSVDNIIETYREILHNKR